MEIATAAPAKIITGRSRGPERTRSSSVAGFIFFSDSWRGRLRNSWAVAAHECERNGEGERQEAEETELEKKVGERATCCRRPLELGCDDEDPPHHGDQPEIGRASCRERV